MTSTSQLDAARGAERRIDMYRREVAERAALLYRLGYTAEQATARLSANADWDAAAGTAPRPLDAHTIGEIVAATFARRPAA
jgi:hypothetical protein